MNIYDPADDIVYLHLSSPVGTRPAPAETATPCAPLPAGYANQSPRTRLQRRPARVRDLPATVVPLTA
jgi:hypothetical protein